jgi:hypothetical protein
MTNPDSNNITIIVSMACDVALLVILLVGLLRLRLEIGEFGLGRILWNQVRRTGSGGFLLALIL